jgi:hypothetical protein
VARLDKPAVENDTAELIFRKGIEHEQRPRVTSGRPVDVRAVPSFMRLPYPNRPVDAG